MQEMTQSSLPSASFSTNQSTTHILKEGTSVTSHQKRLFGEAGTIDTLLWDSMMEAAADHP